MHTNHLWSSIIAISLLTGCISYQPDPAGEARTKIRVTDAQLAELPNPIEVAALKNLWGIAEGQPGPVLTYKCADHPGQFFWVYYSHPKDQPTSQLWVVERIYRADRHEEGRITVWPPGFNE